MLIQNLHVQFFRLIRSCICCVVIIVPFSSSGQDYSTAEFVKKIGSRDGLSNPHVTSIFKDSMGFMWFGTDDGINRYDGYSIKVYRDDTADTTDLKDNRIKKIFGDRSSMMWVVAWSSLHYYDRQKDVFKNVKLPDYFFISDVIEIEDSNFLLSGKLKGIPAILKFDCKTQINSIISFKGREGIVNSIKQHSKHTFWIGGDAVGFQLWNILTEERIDYHINNSFREITNIKNDEYGNLWLGTESGLVRFDTLKKAFTYFTADKNNKSSLQENHILDMLIDGKFIWLGTANGGLSKMNLNSFKFTTYMNDPGNPETISDNSVWSLYKDSQERLWVGTFSKGLNVLDRWVNKFHNLRIPVNNKIVNAILEDSKGRLWIGTEAGIVMRDLQGAIHSFRYQSGQKMIDPVLTIFEDDMHRIWVGTWVKGAALFNEQTKTFTSFISPADYRYSSSHTYGIGQDRKTGHMIFGGYHGISVLKNQNPPIYDHIEDKVFDANLFVRSIYEDRKGRMWIGTLSGLNLLDLPREKMLRCFPHDLIDSSSVQNQINHMIDDHQGNFWAATNKGLFELATDSTSRYYTIKDGLASNEVMGLLQDKNEKFWISTTKGLSSFNKETKKIINFYIEDGLNSLDFKPGSCAQSKDGWFYFGGGEGINFFHPDSIKGNPFPPEIYFTDLKIFNKTIHTGDSSAILPYNLAVTDTIHLPSGSSFFSLTFAALNFSASNRNQYSYTLEGFDKDWNDLGNQRSVSFTNLDPGGYTLRVKASNNDGLWSNDQATLRIYIEPLWYQTLLFKVVIVTGIVSFVMFQIQTIRTRNKILRKTILERTSELENANSELMTINNKLTEVNDSLEHQRALTEEAMMAREHLLSTMSHEIRTPLNSIIGLSQLLKNRFPRPDQQEALNVLHNSGDHLLRLVNDVLDFSKIRVSKLELECIEFTLEELLKQIYLVFEIQAKRKSVRFTIDRDFAIPTRLIGDPTRLEQILFNLINNAIKFTSEGEVKVEVKLERSSDEYVWVEFGIFDTGIGIPSDKMGQIFSPFNQTSKAISRIYGGTGLGLTIVKGLVELMNGKLTFHSEFMQGSSFRVSIPFEYIKSGGRKENDVSSSENSLYPQELNGLTILYAEDVESNQFLMQNLLEDMGVMCEVVNDGEGAIEVCKRRIYDLILMDIEMPGIDGYETAKLIKNDPSGLNTLTPIIGFSAAPSRSIMNGQDGYIIDFVSKPFKTESLVSKILQYVVKE